MTDYTDLAEKISLAAGEFAKEAATEACNELVERIGGSGAPAPVAPIKKALSSLRNTRYFDLMTRVSEAAVASGQRDPQIRRQQAQALIEQGRIDMAVSVLSGLAADTSSAGLTPNASEHAEARGLLGRANKQAYVNAVAAPSLIDPTGSTPVGEQEYRHRVQAYRQYLTRAIDEYFEVYQSDPDRHLWHGINTVACVFRADRDELVLERRPDAHRIAADILAQLESIEPRKVPVWDRATAIEACVALDRFDDALTWLDWYSNDESADAFEFGSTLRQLREVWQLTPGRRPGSHLLPVLHAALLRREGGRVEFAQAAQAATFQQERYGLEAILGDTRFVPLQWYRTGLQRCDAVARIETKWGQAFGSGFLVRGEDIGPALTGKVLLLTNSHVISNDPAVQFGMGAVPPNRARVRFESRQTQGTNETYSISQLLWTSPPNQLDATLLELECALTCDPPCPLAASIPKPNVDRVYVIGHPMGGGLSLSLQDNRVVDVKRPRLHYRAPTEPGSSGSPVFNQDWELVALHHAGGKDMPSLSGTGRVEANEGIWISEIIEALRQALVP